MISLKQKGNFNKTEKFLKTVSTLKAQTILNRYGREGVAVLASATPERTGKTASSWDYRILKHSGSYCIEWFNTNIVDGVPIAIILQYGHSTSTGGWVNGTDYINPAIKPIFKKIADEAWREVTNA